MQALYDQQGVACNSTAEFWDMCQVREDYRLAYARYWAHMDGQTRSGRAVDGIVLPVSPTTAVGEGEFHYFAYSAIANVLDYTSAVFQVPAAASASAEVEGFGDGPDGDEDMTALTELDELVQSTCKYFDRGKRISDRHTAD